MLSDKNIRDALDSKELYISPLLEMQIQPASVDLRLGKKLLDPARGVTFEFETYMLKPREFILGTTMERMTIPETLAAKFEGKSSLGRKGIMTHVTAGFVDPGFNGELTLELFNASTTSIPLIPSMFIGQLCFYRLDAPVLRPYGSAELGSRYQYQTGPTGARP